MKRRYTAICALLIAVGSTYAADTDPSAEAKLFKKLDKDKNGMISQQEAGKQKKLNKNFAKFDTNSDGQIDESEFSAFFATMPDMPEPED